jgi:arylsulfatase A-like enzyme
MSEFTTFNGVPVPVKAQYLWYPFWGSDKTFPHFAAPWAWAMDTPFKWVKQVASHFGGTAQGMAMSWPGHITDVGGIRRQFHHVIDVVPTILEAAGIPQPETVNGIKQSPIEGVSMMPMVNLAGVNEIVALAAADVDAIPLALIEREAGDGERFPLRASTSTWTPSTRPSSNGMIRSCGAGRSQ